MTPLSARMIFSNTLRNVLEAWMGGIWFSPSEIWAIFWHSEEQRWEVHSWSWNAVVAHYFQGTKSIFSVPTRPGWAGPCPLLSLISPPLGWPPFWPLFTTRHLFIHLRSSLSCLSSPGSFLVILQITVWTTLPQGSHSWSLDEVKYLFVDSLNSCYSLTCPIIVGFLFS